MSYIYGEDNHTVHIVQIYDGSNSTPLQLEITCNYFVGSYSIFSTSWFMCIICFFYGAVFIVALSGNGLVCYVVHSDIRMKTVTNLFIVNLAIGDILMALFCVPPSFVSLFVLQYWTFGPTLCPIVNFLQAVSVLVSAYTLVAISIDRYRAIMWPLKPKLSKRQAQFLILSVWMLAVAISSPIPIVSKLTQPTLQHIVCDHYLCEEVWPLAENRYYYSIALLVLQYVIPITVLIFTYASIAVVVWGKRPPGEAENVRDQRMARSKRKTYLRRPCSLFFSRAIWQTDPGINFSFHDEYYTMMVKMMVTVVIVFTICWLPFNIITLIIDNKPKLRSWSGLPFVWMVLHWLAMSHSCYNPVIYCWMNASFRSGFINAISRLSGVHRIVRHGTQRNDNNASLVGIPLNGVDGSGHAGLRRTNTCTTNISVPRQTNGSHNASVRSASSRYNRYRAQHVQRPQGHSEEQL